jgi:hypothetical protein
MPHATESLVDVAHDLRGRVAPAKLEELLPHVTRITMDDGLRDTAEQLVNHGRLVLFGNAVEGFLDNVTSEGIHAKSKCIATNGLGDRDDLVGRAMLEAALNKEVTEAVDHQRIGLGDDCFDDLILLLRCSNFQLLLKKDGCLLVVVADDLVDNVLPVAAHVAVQ